MGRKLFLSLQSDRKTQGRSSVGSERLSHIQEVIGSTPIVPTPFRRGADSSAPVSVSPAVSPSLRPFSLLSPFLPSFSPGCPLIFPGMGSCSVPGCPLLSYSCESARLSLQKKAGPVEKNGPPWRSTGKGKFSISLLRAKCVFSTKVLHANGPQRPILCLTRCFQRLVRHANALQWPFPCLTPCFQGRVRHANALQWPFPCLTPCFQGRVRHANALQWPISCLT